MADSMAGEEGGGGSWWGGWLQTAKEKSASAMEFVKKDLAEFTNTMQRDTTTAVEVTKDTLNETFKNENTNKAKDKMKQSLTGFFDGLSKALTIPPEDDDAVIITPKDLAPGGLYDRSKARLHAIQVDPGTYLNEASGSAELYEQWLEGFSMEAQKGDISELLVVKVEVRALYTKLVPSELSHSEFWQRYFYKVHQLQLDEARKQALMKRAETPTDDDPLGWEDDWSGDEGEEFEKVIDSEVKAIQDKDVQERLTPKPVEDVKEQQPSKQTTDTPTSASPKENMSLKTDDLTLRTDDETIPQSNKDSSVNSVQQKQNIQPEAKCDSLPNIETTKTGESEIKDTELSEKEAEPTLITQEESEKSCVQSSAPDQIEKVHIEETTSDSNLMMKPELPLSTKEADLLNQSNLEKTEPAVEDNLKDMEPSKTEIVPQSQNETVVEEIPQGEKSVEASGEDQKEIKTKVKGDLVVVGSDRESPTSDSSGNKDYLRLLPEPSVDDDWEQDFDCDLTEEDLKAAEEIAKKMGDKLENLDDDWESWE